MKKTVIIGLVLLLVGCVTTAALRPPTLEQMKQMQDRFRGSAPAQCAGEVLWANGFSFADDPNDTEWQIYTTRGGRVVVISHWERGRSGRADAVWEDRDQDGVFEREAIGVEAAHEALKDLVQWCETGRRAS